MGGFTERFCFGRHTVFQISNCLNYLSSVLLLQFVAAFSAWLCEKAGEPHSVLFPQDFLFCSSLSGRWADLNLTFSLVRLHRLLESDSFKAPAHRDGLGLLCLSRSRAPVRSEARAVTVRAAPAFPPRAGHLPPPDAEGRGDCAEA